MNLSERDKKLLLILVVVIIAAATYFFVVSPLTDATEALETEVAGLQERNNYLDQLENSREEYVAGAKDFAVKKEEILAKYPSDMPQEASYQFLYNTEMLIPMKLSMVTYGEFTTAAISAAPVEQATPAEGTEAVTAETAVEPVTAVITDNLTGISEANDYTYSVGYTEFKDFLKYILDYDDRMVITSLTAVYSAETDEVSGNFSMTQYAINGMGRNSIRYLRPSMIQGSSNLFMLAAGNYSGGEASGTADFFVMLCQPDADVDAKIVGKTQDATEDTYLSSDVNNQQEITITFEGAEGEYLATYSIGDKSIAEGVSFVKDGAILLEVMSSPRLGEDDKVAANLSIVNKTDTTVAVDISDDDPTNPRVAITGKTGAVISR